MVRLINFIYLVILFFLFGCGGGDQVLKPEFEHFKIALVQNEQFLPVEDGTVNLKREPFSILVYFTGPDSIFVNASFEPVSFLSAMEGKPLDEIIGFEGSGIEEELFNRNENIYISESELNFWQYSGEKDHRFSGVTVRPGVFICERKIANIVNLNSQSHEQALSIDKIKEDTIYLVFMKIEWNDDYTKRIEKKRRVLILHFND